MTRRPVTASGTCSARTTTRDLRLRPRLPRHLVDVGQPPPGDGVLRRLRLDRCSACTCSGSSPWCPSRSPPSCITNPDLYLHGATALYVAVLLVSSIALHLLGLHGRRHPELLHDRPEVKAVAGGAVHLDDRRPSWRSSSSSSSSSRASAPGRCCCSSSTGSSRAASAKRRSDGRGLSAQAARIAASSRYPLRCACCSGVTPSLSAIDRFAPAASRIRTISWWRATAVAEDDRLEHRGPPEVVDVVDVDAGLDDPAHVVHVPALARGDDRQAAEPVPDGQVRVGGQQRLEHRDAAGDAGDQPGRVVLVVEGVRVRPERDEDPRDVGPVVGHGQQQGVRRRSPSASSSAPRAGPAPRRPASPEVAAASSRRLASAPVDRPGRVLPQGLLQGGDLARILPCSGPGRAARRRPAATAAGRRRRRRRAPAPCRRRSACPCRR